MHNSIPVNVDNLKPHLPKNEGIDEDDIDGTVKEDDDELFTYDSAEEMIADALGDPNWKNSR